MKDGKAVKIDNKFITEKTKVIPYKIRIVRSYGGNATSYCRMIVNKTTTNDTKEVEFDAGTTVEWFVMSIGAMAPKAKIILNGTTVQAGPGSYSMTLNSDLLVQFARGGSGTKLYYEIYITEVPNTIKEVWLLDENVDTGMLGNQYSYPFYSNEGYYSEMFGRDSDSLIYTDIRDSNNEIIMGVYNKEGSGDWESQGYRLVGLTESYLLDAYPEWWSVNAVSYFYKGDTYVLHESISRADLLDEYIAFRSNDTDFTELKVVNDT